VPGKIFCKSGEFLLAKNIPVGRRAQLNKLSDFAAGVSEFSGQGVGFKRSRRRFAPAYAERYAKGEITKEQLEQIKKDLGS
jgi:hypothetical protein